MWKHLKHLDNLVWKGQGWRKKRNNHLQGSEHSWVLESCIRIVRCRGERGLGSCLVCSFYKALWSLNLWTLKWIQRIIEKSVSKNPWKPAVDSGCDPRSCKCCGRWIEMQHVEPQPRTTEWEPVFSQNPWWFWAGDSLRSRNFLPQLGSWSFSSLGP